MPRSVQRPNAYPNHADCSANSNIGSLKPSSHLLGDDFTLLRGFRSLLTFPTFRSFCNLYFLHFRRTRTFLLVGLRSTLHRCRECHSFVLRTIRFEMCNPSIGHCVYVYYGYNNICNMNMNTSHNSCESCEKKSVCICGYKGCVVRCCASCVVEHWLNCPKRSSNEQVLLGKCGLVSPHLAPRPQEVASSVRSVRQSLDSHSR